MTDRGVPASTDTERLLSRRDSLPAGDAGRAALRGRAIELNLALAGRLAHRYRGRGVPVDDLNQVAALALITAVDHFDSGRRSSFVSYAVPTILGSLKRHFRDTAWAVRVPRATQELVLRISGTTGELSQLLGGTPTSSDIAAHLHVDLPDVDAAMSALQAYRVASLTPAGPGADSAALSGVIGRIEQRYADVEDRAVLRPLIAALPPREQRVLRLYYFAGMSQTGVAAEAGMSQMNVSRLLRHALGTLRADLQRSTPAERAAAHGSALQ